MYFKKGNSYVLTFKQRMKINHILNDMINEDLDNYDYNLLYCIYKLFQDKNVVLKIYDKIVNEIEFFFKDKNFYCIENINIYNSDDKLVFYFYRLKCNKIDILESTYLKIDKYFNCEIFSVTYDKIFYRSRIKFDKAIKIIKNVLFKTRFIKDDTCLFGVKFYDLGPCKDFFSKYLYYDKELEFLPYTKHNYKIDYVNDYFVIKKKEGFLKDLFSKFKLLLK